MINDKQIQIARTNKNSVKNLILSAAVLLLPFMSVSIVSAFDGQTAIESAIPHHREMTFFNSEPAYRKTPPASFRKQPPKKLMENVGGLYYIVDAFSFAKADNDRSGEYRALGKTVLVEETLLIRKTTER